MDTLELILIFLQFIIFKYGNIHYKKFEQLFGVHCLTAGYLYAIAYTHDPTLHPVWILQFLHWICHYPTNVHAAQFWNIDVKIWRKHIYLVLFVLVLGLNTVCI